MSELLLQAIVAAPVLVWVTLFFAGRALRRTREAAKFLTIEEITSLIEGSRCNLGSSIAVVVTGRASGRFIQFEISKFGSGDETICWDVPMSDAFEGGAAAVEIICERAGLAHKFEQRGKFGILRAQLSSNRSARYQQFLVILSEVFFENEPLDAWVGKLSDQMQSD